MRRAIVILALALAGCGGAAAVAGGGYGDTTTTVARAPEKVEICHKTGNGYNEITIAASALPAHLAHGDIYPVPPEGCPEDHGTTTTKPEHTTTTYKQTTTTVGHATTTTTIKTTTTTTGGGGTTTTVHTTTTTTGGGGTTTTSSSTTTSTTRPPSGTTTTSSPQQTTTTTATPPPLVPPGEGVFVRAAGTTCDNEVPKIIITFGNLEQFDGRVGTLTMTDLNGNLLSTQPLTYQSGTTVALLYPGTRVNADGTIADVPGWNLQPDGFWVEDPTDAFLRDGIVLIYEVNPTATAIVSYPPASSGCNTPPGPTPPPHTPGTPSTPGSPTPPGQGLPPTL